MAAYDVVQLASMGQEVDGLLAQRHRVLQWEQGAPAPSAAELAAIPVAVTSVRRGFPQALFEDLPALRAICSWGVGFETLDVASAARRGVMVSNTPGVLDACVADLAWALLLAAARRVAAGDRYVKDGHWREIGKFPLSTRASGKRMGILGLGRIGAAIARRATGFDMEVRYTSRNARPDAPWPFVPDLRALAQWSDFLVVACAGGPQTRHLVDAGVLRALGPGGILVNIARGTVVDQPALVAALLAGELGGAGLDVLDGEPAVPPEFTAMNQVVLTPHVGSATHETRADMARLVLDNVEAFFDTGSLLTPVAATA